MEDRIIDIYIYILPIPIHTVTSTPLHAKFHPISHPRNGKNLVYIYADFLKP